MLTFILKPISEETAKVGNTVFDIFHGFGTINYVGTNGIGERKISAAFPSIRDTTTMGDDSEIDGNRWYLIDGKITVTAASPHLFHVPPMLTKTYKVNTIETFVKITVDTINEGIK